MNSHSRVYLAGPISGLIYGDAASWRHAALLLLKPHGIDCFSPLRQKRFLEEHAVIEGSYEDRPLARARGIMTRDHHDCSRADMILANLHGASRVSIGTVMEIAWAHAYRKPLVLIMEPHGNVHDHPMITEAVGYRVESLSEAADVVKAVLLPD